MNILVVGCGHVGASLIQILEEEGHDISLVEKDPEQLRRLEQIVDYTFGGSAIVADGTDPEVLRRAGIESCDAVVAVGLDDAENLMTAQIAQKIFHKENVQCRVSDSQLAKTYREQYGFETICPTDLTINALFGALNANA